MKTNVVQLEIMRIDPSKIIPTSDDTAERWVVFHKALKSWFGKKSANAFFLQFWGQRAGAGTSADTHKLRDYLDTQGIDLTTDRKGEITDTALDFLGWFEDTANQLRAVVIGTVILGVGLVAYYIIKNTNKGKSAQQIIMDAPLSIGRWKSAKAIGGANASSVTKAIGTVNLLKR
jgi:hypothetical protein